VGPWVDEVLFARYAFGWIWVGSCLDMGGYWGIGYALVISAWYGVKTKIQNSTKW
jgi:hypothetical protein